MSLLKHYAEFEIQEFERRWNISLPTDYREFLIATGPVGYVGPLPIDHLEDWCQPDDPENFDTDFLSKPFPHTGPWNDKTLFDKKRGWESPYYSAELWCGAMRIVNTGCEGYYILVVSGPERGNIWVDDRVPGCYGGGIFPFPHGGQSRVSFGQYVKAQ